MRSLPLPARPHRHDVLIAAAGLLSGVALWGIGLVNDLWAPDLPRSLTLLPLAAMSGAELLRRTAPRAALAVAVTALAFDQTLTGSLLSTVLMFTDVVYAAVVYGTPAQARRIPAVCLFLTVVATVVPTALIRTPDALLIGVGVGLVALGPAWTGAIIRTHRETAAAERLRAEQTARLSDLDRRIAVGEERARMARELHDLVANHLSAIAIHSSAALSLAERDPRAAGRALRVIRESSVQGLAEMRRLIGLLREAARDDEPAAVPRLEALDAVLDRARAVGAASGLDFALHDERPAEEELPAPLELAAYRIVQESVTNALKHASPGTVTVRLDRSAEALAVTVDSPCAREPGPRAPGAGAGLVGMRERALLLDGMFEAGPLAAEAGGTVWRVRAELPFRSGRPAARPAPEPAPAEAPRPEAARAEARPGTHSQAARPQKGPDPS